MKFLFKLFLFSTLLVISKSYTFQSNNFTTCLDKIYENHTFCMKNQNLNKIYLNANKIKVVDNGIFLQVNESEKIPLKHLYANDKGNYIYSDNFITNCYIYKCIGCGCWRDTESDFCYNPECPLYNPDY